MIYNTLKLAHLLSIMVWIGGMVFVHFYLRPAVQSLEPPQRIRLMHDVLQRFLNSVLIASSIVLGTGLWMIGRVAKEAVQSGGSFSMPLSWTIMATLGIIMMAILGHIRFALFKRLQRAVTGSDWAAGANALNSIRKWVSVNLSIGVVIVAVTLLMK